MFVETVAKRSAVGHPDEAVFRFEFPEVVPARHARDLTAQIAGPLQGPADKAMLLVIEEAKPSASAGVIDLEGKRGQ